MNLNLYVQHFSYISNMAKYSHSFLCSKWDRLWKHVGIDIPEEDRYYPYRATYDIEVMLQSTDKRQSEKLDMTNIS